MAASGRESGVYRSQDPLKNFKIRLKVEKCSSEYPSTPVIGNQNSLDSQDFSCLDSLRSSKLEPVEDRIINWQQKIFSNNEIKKYSNEEACLTPLAKEHFKLLQNHEANVRCRHVIFTYINEDEPAIDNIIITSPSDNPTSLHTNITDLRNRKSGKTVNNLERDAVTNTTKNFINDNISRDQQKMNHCGLKPTQTMRIMAMIKDDKLEVCDNYYEATLVTINVDSGGVVVITPDFNFGKKPYRLNTCGLNEVYYYTVEHVSNDNNPEEIENDAKLQIKPRPHLPVIPINYEFPMADPNLLRLHILGEIVSAEEFEYDGLSVNFFLDLPRSEEWVSDDNLALYNVTQTCNVKSNSRKKVAYFSYPFEYEIACPVNFLVENTDNVPKWPTICLQVLSTDSWQRIRTEGYGYVNVPYNTGSYSLEIKTWRPFVPSLSSQLRRFFIGGSPELTDLSHTAVPSNVDGPFLSRYGMRSETSGVVSVRLHIVQQCKNSRAEFDRYYNPRTEDNFTTLQKNVEEVIEAFHRARQRMLVAREKFHL